MLHFHKTNEVYLSLLTRFMFTYAFFFFVANAVVLYKNIFDRSNEQFTQL